MTTTAASSMLIRKLPALIVLAGLVAIGMQASPLIGQLITASDDSTAPQIQTNTPNIKPQQLDRLFSEGIADRRLWNELPVMDKSESPWKLQGIIKATNPEDSMALLTAGPDAAKSYKAGETLMDGAKLIAIGDHYIILLNQDIFYKLTLG